MKSAKSPVIRSRKLERCKGHGAETVPRRGRAKESASEAPDVIQTQQSQDSFADDCMGKEVHDGRNGNLKSCDSTVTSFLPEGESSSNESPSTWSTLHTVAERVAVEALLQLQDSTLYKDKRARLLSLTRALQDREDESKSPRNKRVAAAISGQRTKSLRVVIKNCKESCSASKKSVSRNRSYVRSLMELNNKKSRTPIEKKTGSRKRKVQRLNSTSKQQWTFVVRRKVSRKVRSLNQIVQSLTSKAGVS